MATMLCLVVCDLWLNNLSDRNEPHGEYNKRHNHSQCHVALVAFFKPSASQPEEETSMNRPLTKQTCTAWDPLYRSSLQVAFVGIGLWLWVCLRIVALLGLPLTRVCRIESPTVAYRWLVVFSPHFSLLLFAEWRMLWQLWLLVAPLRWKSLDGFHVNVSTCRLLTRTPACTLGTWLNAPI